MVSVLMPAYNRENYITASINSVLAQTYNNFELIITDDGSTDKTLDVIKQFSDSRIRVLTNEQNMGIAFTRNRMLQEAKGDFVMLLDSDDMAMPGRMQTQVGFLLEHPDVLLVGSGAINIDEHGKALTGKIDNRVNEKEPQQIQAMLLFRNCLCQSSLMINKAQLNTDSYNLDYPPYEDYELWCRLSKKHKLVNLDEPQVKYRVHASNISFTTKDKIKMDLFNKITKQQFQYYFNYEPTAKELYTHGALHYSSLNTGYTYLSDAGKWLKKIAELNKAKNIFSQPLFINILKNNWYERCWYLAEKGYLFSTFYFLLLNPAFNRRDLYDFIRLLFKSGISKFKSGNKL